MGYLRRHAIAVTGTYGNDIDKAHAFAQGTGAQVTDIYTASINNERTFFVCPDGSKEGWHQSDAGDDQRYRIVEYLKSVAYEDGSSPLAWCEFFYGDEMGETAILNRNTVGGE
mgnify:CR=1 FL=1